MCVCIIYIPVIYLTKHSSLQNIIYIILAKIFKQSNKQFIIAIPLPIFILLHYVAQSIIVLFT